MLPQDFESIQAENPKNDEQYYQPYIDQIIMKHFCCYSPENEIYQNTLDQKFICKECYRFKITFFESEISVPFLNRHIVTTDLNELKCSVCEEQIFFIRFRADQCFLCTEYLFELANVENE